MFAINCLFTLARFFVCMFLSRYKGKLGQCDLDSLNEDGLQLLQDEFGLTNGVVYYDFVKRGRARATSACELDDGAFLELSEQASTVIALLFIVGCVVFALALVCSPLFVPSDAIRS